MITRVVGPGTQDQFNNGFLANWQTYVQNGIVSPYAYMSYSGEYSSNDSMVGSVISIYLNGWLIAQEPVLDHITADCIKIPIQYVKFAQRVPGASPNPSNNMIDVSIDGNFANGDAGINLGNLSFQAMAPIILVHGINADELWFKSNSFTTPFDTADAPYASAVFPASTIPESGMALLPVIPELAQQFGATKVHIIAHSKGGIWSRYFLKYGPISTDLSAPPTPSNFGVLSLITLDTPNNGSVLASLVTGSINVASLLALEAGPEAAAALDIVLELASGYLDQITDLTRGAVENINAELGDPPLEFIDVDGTIYTIYKGAVAADADIGDKVNASGNRYIDSTDCAGMSVFGVQLDVHACQAMYWIMGHEDNLYAASTSYDFDYNDLVVTQNSASVLNYVNSSTPYNVPIRILDPIRKNHQTVGDSCVSGGTGTGCTSGSGVLGVIQRIFPVQ